MGRGHKTGPIHVISATVVWRRAAVENQRVLNCATHWRFCRVGINGDLCGCRLREPPLHRMRWTIAGANVELNQLDRQKRRFVRDDVFKLLRATVNLRRKIRRRHHGPPKFVEVKPDRGLPGL
ncbi:hypothetical protein KCP75_04615 [Salmonella enterica subsp. enterica]|nr:hypothetical protein KCP75_04615 [Salmonella enterica subsp. enterica]